MLVIIKRKKVTLFGDCNHIYQVSMDYKHLVVHSETLFCYFSSVRCNWKKTPLTAKTLFHLTGS